jgi:hypothetical protein
MAVFNHRASTAQGQLTVAQVNLGACIVAPILGKKITVVDAWVRAIGGNAGTHTLVAVTDGYLHHTTDTSTIATTNPAVTEQNSYDLSVELMGDFNTHIAAVAYHRVARAAVTSTAATTEPTLIAQVNVARTALIAHFRDAGTHGGNGDPTRLALAQATTVATTAATAIVLENLLATYYLAHITVTTALNTVHSSFARAGLTSGAWLRVGAANTTATNLLLGGAVDRGIWIVKTGADMDTATALDYCVTYVADNA